MAPEQATGGNIGPRTDQYALAVIAYALLAGRHPFDGADTVRLIYQIVEENPPPLSTINPALSREIDLVFLKALSKEPARRFESCRELFDKLNESLAKAPGTGSATRLWSALKRILRPETSSERVSAEKLSKSPAQGQKSAPSSKGAEPLAPNPISSTFAGPSDLPPVTPPRARSQEPGEFTKLFGNRIEGPASPLPRPPQKLPSDPAPGEFTRVFQRPEQTVILRKAPEQRIDAETLARAQQRRLHTANDFAL